MQDASSDRRSFPALTGNLVFFRTYSHLVDGHRETWEQVCERAIAGLAELGKLTQEEIDLIYRMAIDYKAMPSGRWLWVGGRDWVKNPENFSGAYNCTSTNIVDVKSFALMMSLAMMGSGTGAVLSETCISQLPPISNKIAVKIVRQIGEVAPKDRKEKTSFERIEGDRFLLTVGDSREGWASSYNYLLLAAMSEAFSGFVNLEVDLGNVRPAGEKLKGFGGVSNPVKLPGLYERCAAILNKAIGRKLTSVECCLLIDEAAVVVVAGNVRRCLPKSALVHTIMGLVPIEQVKEGMEVETHQGMRKVLKNFDQGRQQVYRVNTNANPLFATEEHKVAVLTDTKGGFIWKKVKDLSAGDRLLHTTQILPGINKQLPDNEFCDRPKHSTTCQQIKIPSLNPDVSWLIGYTHGNGHVALGRNNRNKSYGYVAWSLNSKTELTKLINVKISKALESFGIVPTAREMGGENTLVVKAHSIQLSQYFLANVKRPKESISIPSWILTASPECRGAYLAGLMDSDGCINKRVLVGSIYPDFLRQVGALYASLGIASKLKLERAEIGNWKDYWHLTLPAFKAKYNKLVAPYSVKGNVQVGEQKRVFTVPGSMMVQDYSWSFLGTIGVKSSISNTSYETFCDRVGSLDQIPVTVLSVQPWKECETYDLEVEDQHCFFVEGLLVHNSAGIRQADYDDRAFAAAKDNLWQQDSEGNWRIDPERDALRMANHTRVFHHKPTLEEVIESVTKQYYSGEGAIQWAGEAIARSSADLLSTPALRAEFIKAYQDGWGGDFLRKMADGPMPIEEIEDRLQRFGLNPCGEILGKDFHCNLAEIHLNQIDPLDMKEQSDAFRSGSIVAAALLHHKFAVDRYQRSRELDPIIGVSFTGLFDFFVEAFGADWLRWWECDRRQDFWVQGEIPNTLNDLHSRFYGYSAKEYFLTDGGYLAGRLFSDLERQYLSSWKWIVRDTVWEYCDRHNLKRPNRYTTVQPSGSKALLTGASSGWHPPKGARYIRRITFAKNDPVALACLDAGYSVIPAQSDKDENGMLLNDPFDPRCTEWLVEIPVATPWADLEGCDRVDISKFSAVAQFDFYMQVQRYYTTHNTSATIELREGEVEALAHKIHYAIDKDLGYISSALLARFDDHQAFPRLPFEPISKEKYEQMVAEVSTRRKADFLEALEERDRLATIAPAEEGPAACDSDKCLL